MAKRKPIKRQTAVNGQLYKGSTGLATKTANVKVVAA